MSDEFKCDGTCNGDDLGDCSHPSCRLCGKRPVDPVSGLCPKCDDEVEPSVLAWRPTPHVKDEHVTAPITEGELRAAEEDSHGEHSLLVARLAHEVRRLRRTRPERPGPSLEIDWERWPLMRSWFEHRPEVNKFKIEFRAMLADAAKVGDELRARDEHATEYTLKGPRGTYVCGTFEHEDCPGEETCGYAHGWIVQEAGDHDPVDEGLTRDEAYAYAKLLANGS